MPECRRHGQCGVAYRSQMILGNLSNHARLSIVPRNRYAYLDGIRGLAAILVLVRHTGNFWHFGFYRSYLAVDLFFILSGFVIAYAYDEKLREGAISFTQFLKIRLIRLYPVFLMSLVMCAIVALISIFFDPPGTTG